MYGTTMYQPYQNPYLSQIEHFNNLMPAQNLIRVNGIDGAKAYQMPANSTVALFDSNEDIMYVKTTDGAGFPSVRSFKFTEMTQETKQAEKVDYISREEFEEFKKELMNNGKQSIQWSKSNLNDKSSDN